MLAVAVAAAYGARLHRRRSPRPIGPGGLAAESEAARAEADRISGSAADDLARLRLRAARGAAEPNPAFDADGQPEYEMILPDGSGVNSVFVGGFAVPLWDDGVGTSHIYSEFEPSAAGAGRLGRAGRCFQWPSSSARHSTHLSSYRIW